MIVAKRREVASRSSSGRGHAVGVPMWEGVSHRWNGRARAGREDRVELPPTRARRISRRPVAVIASATSSAGSAANRLTASFTAPPTSGEEELVEESWTNRPGFNLEHHRSLVGIGLRACRHRRRCRLAPTLALSTLVMTRGSRWPPAGRPCDGEPSPPPNASVAAQRRPRSGEGEPPNSNGSSSPSATRPTPERLAAH